MDSRGLLEALTILKHERTELDGIIERLERMVTSRGGAALDPSVPVKRAARGTPGRYTLKDVFPPSLLSKLVQNESGITTDQMAEILDAQRTGPLVYSWKRRVAAVGRDFDTLVTRHEENPPRYSLTEEGRRVFTPVLEELNRSEAPVG